MLFTLPFPTVGPVLVEVGPFVIRWYALAYIVGLVLGWRYCLYLARHPRLKITATDIDDFLVWATLGVILGGRLGFVLFYQPREFLAHPVQIPMVWHGGMSFHGGLLGVILAMLLFTRSRRLPFFMLADIVACATPIGLFLGRLANFVNAELYGRPSDVPWAMVFPTDPEGVPRHPSQLYEAFLEGIVLFLVLFAFARFGLARRQLGKLSGLFLIFYGLFRIAGELFREPDANLSYLVGGTTMGQWLSVPMVLIGLLFLLQSRTRPAA
jgi:phosphatidylglycerol:prolipoprotein diacylglycerol transferase